MVDDAASRYDFSEYPPDLPLYDTCNRKALGFFKDELNSVHMREFVGLRPKCYAFVYAYMCNFICIYVYVYMYICICVYV